jgi:hydroxypyruvate isomerase
MTESHKIQADIHSISRRQVLKQLAIGATGVGLMGRSATLLASDRGDGLGAKTAALKGNIHHSVSRWTYGDLSIDELCKVVKELGFSAIDLVGPQDWPIMQQHGVYSSMCNGAELNLTDGWADPQFHEALIERYHRHIDLVADAGYVNLVCFSGSKRGMDPKEGLEHAVKGLTQVLPHAEKRGVVLQMEVFNSKIDHPDYMADNTPWAIELCKRLDSPHFKLLYDIYHMQIMEGDIIRTIRDSHQYFGHYQTAGVPGRHEIDDSQELFYPAIARAIVETGFKGFLAQEFIPTAKDMAGKITSLQQAIQICDV